MSRGTGLGIDRQVRDFTLATTEEFVHKFGGKRAINKVSSFSEFIDESYLPIQSRLSIVKFVKAIDHAKLKFTRWQQICFSPT